nr:transglycosylase domain-containing protein [Rhabdothermincola salaria]
MIVFVVTVFAAGGLLAGAVVAVGPQLAMVASAGSGEPEPIDLNAFGDYAVRSQVFAMDGTPIATLHGEENRSPVPLDRVPEPVLESILAVEDAEFFEHNGINVRSIARALVENVSAGGVAQGGSTITQQLVKNALLSDERTFERKIEEAVLALRLEEQMSKDEILETYLNTVYFGSGAYGVQAAAETYWGKNVEDLGWAEGAMLAALISNPSAYDPTVAPERARQQRQIALERLVSLDVITRDEATLLGLVPLPTARCTGGVGERPEWCGEVDTPPADNYFVEYVKNQLLDDPKFSGALGDTDEERFAAVFGGGLRVHTTVDIVAQFAAQVAHAEETPPNDVGVTSAFVALEPATGAVRALVGGPPFGEEIGENKYDIATTTPGRQTGSTFKTFVLLEALEQGALPFDTVRGTVSMVDPGTFEDYEVEGRGGTLNSITSASSNGAFVRLNQVLGPQNVVNLATRMGLDNLPSNAAGIPSLPLGVSDQTPLQMASAYSAIPNGGVQNPPYFIERIEDRSGNVLWEHEGVSRRVLSPRTACLASEILAANVTGGTGRNAALPGQPAAGKTGTTTGPSDVWFIGFTPYLSTAVWVGHPEQGAARVDGEGEPISGSTYLSQLPGRQAWGSTFPAAIWQRFNELYHNDKEERGFPGCEPPSRSGRPLQGKNDPYGSLNGGYDPTGVGVVAGPLKGYDGPVRPPSPPRRAESQEAPDGGGDDPPAEDGGAPAPPAPAPPPAPQTPVPTPPPAPAPG